MTAAHWTPEMGVEAARLDDVFAETYVPDPLQRGSIFAAAGNVLGRGPRDAEGGSRTGLALGYVQSGKTMSFTALTALAADNGYRIIVAFLGSTDLLLKQNTERLMSDLGIGPRTDYRWVHLPQPSDDSDLAAKVDSYLRRDRAVLITILKNATRIGRTARLLGKCSLVESVPALIIDDEADQVSLNTKVRDEEESRAYEEIGNLRAVLGPTLYVQYTATPFAPLLLQADDRLSPAFVELLEPGPDYAGGEAFFIENSRTIVREISEDEAEDVAPEVVPNGLRSAMGVFFASTALLRDSGRASGPISMLIHPSHLTAVHAHYLNMVQELVRSWSQRLNRALGDPGRQAVLDELHAYRRDLVTHGVDDVADELFEQLLTEAVSDAEIWMVNSWSEFDSIDWSRSPVHLLIGGNKLDRGFTVKGLTVTYMTRRATGGQADTIEQRARSFGYKRPYLDYCRFYAPPSVISAFRSLVHTESDMRASLSDWAAEGLPLERWAVEVGLVLQPGMRPTRPVVIQNPSTFDATGWQMLRRPSLAPEDLATNAAIVRDAGLLDAPAHSFGRVQHRMLVGVPVSELLTTILEPWRLGPVAGWQHERIVDYLRRRDRVDALDDFDVLLLEAPNGEPRTRGYGELGLSNLMQGPDEGTGYPGDYNLRPGRPHLQVHRVRPRSTSTDELFTLALFVPAADDRFPSVVRTQRA